MTDNKVADNPTLIDDDTYRAIQNNEKIYLFHEKYEDQPEYRYGHRTLIAGSSVTSFDTKINKWNNFRELAPLLSINESQKLDDFLFTFSGSIFMLLVNRFEGLQIDSLWKFDDQTLEWSKHSQINEILEKSTGDNTFGSKVLIVGGDQTNEGPYFVAKITTSENSSFVLFKLNIGDQASVNVLHRIHDLYSVLPAIDPLPFAAICTKQKIYISLAERGCGYRWRTEDVLQFDLETKKLESTKIFSQNPTFGLMMATENRYNKQTDSWFYFGSLSKIGGFHLPASEQTPETRFYSIENLTSSEPQWKESDLLIVDPGRDDIYVPSESSVYVISRKKGTLKLAFGDFHTIKSTRDEL